MADVITLNEIDEIKNLLTGSIAVIGKTTDTGGTATSGTVMAKLNTLLSNNSTLVAANTNHGNIAYTTAGTYTWTAPEGVSEVLVMGSGGSGGGGGGSGGAYEYYYQDGCSGSSGGSGSVPPVMVTKVSVIQNTSYTITVGAAGSAGSGGAGAKGRSDITSSAGGNGGAGGDTKFGTLFTFPGGTAGTGGGAANTKFSGDYNCTATPGAAGKAGGLVRPSKTFLINWEVGVAGAAGSKGADSAATVTSGGASKTNNFGIKSGAGGAGGTYEGGAAGSAGSAGTAGFIALAW